MSLTLARLTSVEKSELEKTIQRLESLTEHQSIDNRLLASLKQEVDTTVSVFGLDKDYTAKELYYASLSFAEDQDRLLWDKHLTLLEAMEHMAAKLQKNFGGYSALAIKKTVIKKLLLENPPRMVFKKTGYNTVGSLSKHMSMYQIVAWAKILESKSWHAKWEKACAKLPLNSYDLKPAEIIILTMKNLPHSHASDFPTLVTFPIYESGAVGIIVPAESQTKKGLVFLASTLAQDVIQEFLATEIYIRLKRTQMDFSKSFAHIQSGQPLASLNIGGVYVDWDVVVKVLQHTKRSQLPESVKSYLSKSDLTPWDVAELYGASFPEALKKDWLGAEIHGKLITLSCVDIAYNAYYGSSFDKRMQAVFGNNLRKELYYRYVQNPHIVPYIIEAVDQAIEGILV